MIINKITCGVTRKFAMNYRKLMNYSLSHNITFGSCNYFDT